MTLSLIDVRFSTPYVYYEIVFFLVQGNSEGRVKCYKIYTDKTMHILVLWKFDQFSIKSDNERHE